MVGGGRQWRHHGSWVPKKEWWGGHLLHAFWRWNVHGKVGECVCVWVKPPFFKRAFKFKVGGTWPTPAKASLTYTLNRKEWNAFPSHLPYIASFANLPSTPPHLGIASDLFVCPKVCMDGVSPRLIHGRQTFHTLPRRMTMVIGREVLGEGYIVSSMRAHACNHMETLASPTSTKQLFLFVKNTWLLCGFPL